MKTCVSSHSGCRKLMSAQRLSSGRIWGSSCSLGQAEGKQGRVGAALEAGSSGELSGGVSELLFVICLGCPQMSFGTWRWSGLGFSLGSVKSDKSLSPELPVFSLVKWEVAAIAGPAGDKA
jgi:hypothetical protein